MAAQAEKGDGPDLTAGITLAAFGGRRLLRGFVGKKPVLLARLPGDEVVAIGDRCTHYGGRLDRGALEGEAVRCPLHHALFSLRTGEALGAPAFDPVPVWKVERTGEHIAVREAAPQPAPQQLAPPADVARIVIVGGGAAGFAAAEMLRRRGYAGSLTLLSAEDYLPCDRPNLSKDYLAGSAQESWMPLRPGAWYGEAGIDLQLSTPVARIDTAAREVLTGAGARHGYDRLLLATGAEPVRLPIPGADRPHVFTLRSMADSRAISKAAEGAKTAVVLGSGFIGMEVAASLAGRGLAVRVVSRDPQPLHRVLGEELGAAIRARHEAAGVQFDLGTTIADIAAGSVTLEDGSERAADLVILGVGVRPRLGLAEAAGLRLDRGIVVDEYLQSSVPGVYAAGDVARWPWRGGSARVEHWVVATRQGQVAAENMLGARRPFRDVPFFWSAHPGFRLQYVGFTEGWDEAVVEGDIAGRDCAVSYRKDGRTLAVATVGRPQTALAEARRLAAEG